VGGSDCERIGQGFLAQPANALSSIAYLFVGVLLLQRALAGRPRAALAAYAATVIGVGLGSAAYHGPMPSWGRFAHDLTIAAVLAFVVGNDVALARGARMRTAIAISGVLLGVSAVVLAVAPDATNVLDAVLVVAAVGAELAAARSSPTRVPGVRRAWIVGIAALTIGVALNALGRTDAPLCDPESPVQLHAAWHVITAFVLWLYGTAVLEPRERGRRIIPG
jgi:Ceramidase